MNRPALADENYNAGLCKGYDEDAAAHEDAPELDDWEDAVLEEKTVPV